MAVLHIKTPSISVVSQALTVTASAMVKKEYEELIGIPFEYYARGPEKYDCYGFLMMLYKRFRGIELPDYGSAEGVEHIAVLMAGGMPDWKEVEPFEGAAIMFRVNGLGAHVGYCIGDGKFIHTWEGSAGVVIERIETWKRRIIGFYDYAGK